MPQVVGVEIGDVWGRRQLRPEIACCCNSGIFDRNYTDPLVLGGKPFGDRPRAVTRAVVDDDDLQLGVCLGERSLDRAADVQLLVVRRNDRSHRRKWPGLAHAAASRGFRTTTCKARLTGFANRIIGCIFGQGARVARTQFAGCVHASASSHHGPPGQKPRDNAENASSERVHRPRLGETARRG